jgi:hypothetical protein
VGKQTILTCDWHEKVVVPAVVTYQLSNGIGKPLTIDLCKPHEEALLTIFRPYPLLVSPAGLSKKDLYKLRDRERHAQKRARIRAGTDVTSARSLEVKAHREDEVMKVMNTIKHNVHINEIIKATGLTTAPIRDTLIRLAKQNKIVATGGRGRWRRYHLPT